MFIHCTVVSSEHTGAALPPRYLRTYRRILLLVGATACAIVFTYQGLRDAEGDRHRWKVTMARWFASRDFPSYGRVWIIVTKTSLPEGLFYFSLSAAFFCAYRKTSTARGEKTHPFHILTCYITLTLSTHPTPASSVYNTHVCVVIKNEDVQCTCYSRHAATRSYRPKY
jgi:hypothetical protein